MSTPVPLRPLVPFDSEEIFVKDFPEHDYYPEVENWSEKERHLVSTVGYWPEANHFPLLVVEDMAKVFPETTDPAVRTDLLRSPERRHRLLSAHGILVNFAAAVATANNQGFTLYHEVTTGGDLYLAEFPAE